MLANYIISLASSVDRRKHIDEQFSKEDIRYHFFDAVTPQSSNEVAKKLKINTENADLTAGEIACFLSHISLWQKMLDDGLDYIAIFEDDVYLGENIASFLSQDNWIPKDTHIIKLEMFDKNILMGFAVKILKKGRRLKQLYGCHLGGAGYILSAQAARLLLEYVRENQPIIAVDHVIFEDIVEKQILPVYQLLPALCIQSDRCDVGAILESNLEHERRKRLDKKFHIEKKIKMEFKAKMRREVLRIWMQIRMFFSKISFR